MYDREGTPQYTLKSKANAHVQVGGRVGFAESGAMLDIAQHRPDIRATLQEATTEAAELADGADVGVYVAGPHADTSGCAPKSMCHVQHVCS